MDAVRGVGAAGRLTMAMTLYEPAFNVLTKRYPERYREGHHRADAGGRLREHAVVSRRGGIAWRGWAGAARWPSSARCADPADDGAAACLGPARPGAGGRHRRTAKTPLADATLHQALRQGAFWLLTLLTFMLYCLRLQAALWAHVMPAFVEQGPDRGATRWRCWCGWGRRRWPGAWCMRGSAAPGRCACWAGWCWRGCRCRSRSSHWPTPPWRWACSRCSSAWPTAWSRSWACAVAQVKEEAATRPGDTEQQCAPAARVTLSMESSQIGEEPKRSRQMRRLNL